MVRNMKKYLENIAVILLSLLILVGILAVTFLLSSQKKEKVQVLLMGDSIFGQYRDETSVAYYLSEELGMGVFNGAFGGSCMAMQNVEEDKYYYLDAFNFVNLSRAVAYEDFGVQQTVRTKDVPTAHFPSVVDDMETIDMDSVKVLVLCYGLNDYMAGTPLDDSANPMNEATFCGALRQGVERIRKEHPNMRIIVASSTYCWFLNTMEDCENNDYGGGYLEEYIEAERKTCQELDIEFIDWYHDFYNYDSIERWAEHTEDGMHPNQDTRKWMARVLATIIMS